MYLKSGRILKLAAASIALICTPAVQAQQGESGQTVELAQDDIQDYFSDATNAVLWNWWVDHWTMQRRVSGTTLVRRCYIRFNTPTVVSKTSLTSVADHYDMDFTQLSSVRWDGKNGIDFRAEHMASNEYGKFEVGDSTDAERLASDLTYLAKECGGWDP